MQYLWRCRRFWTVALPLAALPLTIYLLIYGISYALLRLFSCIQVAGDSSAVNALRIGGRLFATAAAVFRFYEPLIAWECRRKITSQ